MLPKNKIITKNEKNNKKTELDDILENIIEVNSNDGKTIKRRNSFTGKNIFQKRKKEKEIEKNKKIYDNMEKKENEEQINILEDDKNSFSSLKHEIEEDDKNNENGIHILSNKKNIEISKISGLKSNKSYKTLKNNYNKMNLNEKSSHLSSCSGNRNFILKSELFKTENSCGGPQENEKMKKKFLFLLTDKNEKKGENPFYKYFIGNNTEDKIDFKQNNDNKKNIYTNTYIDNDEEEEINEEKDKFKNILSNFDDKSLNEKYGIKNKLIPEDKKKEEEIIQEKILQEKVYKIIKCDNCNNELDGEKDITSEYNENKTKSIEQKKISNTNFTYPNKTDNNMKNLIQYNIQNNYINNNFGIPNPQNYMYMNQSYYYPYNQSYSYFNNLQNPNIYQYNNQKYFNPNMNINNRFNNYKNNNFYQYNNNMNQIKNNNNNHNIYNLNNLNNIDEVQLAKMSINLLKTQMGLKILEKQIKSNNEFANNLLFPELKDKLTEICCDLFGNILMQNLLDILSEENINIFLSSIQEKLFEICLTEYGSRVVQKLIEKIQKNHILMNIFIFNLTKKDIGILFKSKYSNYVIQKYLLIIKDVHLTNFIYNYLYKNFMDIARTKYGVCVIQKCFSEGNELQRKKIVDIILNEINNIMKDCYANYLIQYIFFKFDNNKFNEILPIIKKIEENIVDYCKNIFSSSVIEKCFEKNETKIGEIFIKSLLEKHPNDILNILLNSHGRYIIKKSLNFDNKKYNHTIINIILENIKKVKLTPEEESILESFKNDYPEFSFLFLIK